MGKCSALGPRQRHAKATVPTGAPGRSPRSGTQTMPASEQGCGWAVTMVRGPTRQQSQLPIRVRQAQDPGYSFVPPVGTGPGPTALNGWWAGRQEWGRGWRAGWGRGEAGSCFQGPHTSASLGQSTSWGTVPADREVVTLPPPTLPSELPLHEAQGLVLLEGGSPSPRSGMFQAAGQSTRGPLQVSPGLPQPGCRASTGSAHFHSLRAQGTEWPTPLQLWGSVSPQSDAYKTHISSQDLL